MRTPNHDLPAQINKRLTLNLLIQGSSQHAFLTSHYLVRDELAEIDPERLDIYDRFALGGFVQYWCGRSLKLIGSPADFWKNIKNPAHPFAAHPFLVRHGFTLADAARERAFDRCRAKGVSLELGVFSSEIMKLLQVMLQKEVNQKPSLELLAKRATAMVWGIPFDQLDAELTTCVTFGTRAPAQSFAARTLRASAIGYGGVLEENGQFRVVAKAWVWPILSHELTKGVAELICLHGLNTLDADTYSKTLAAADRIEHEPWMLQAGSELWRRLLTLLPTASSMPLVLAHIAKLPPHSLETLMMAIVENPNWARELIASLCN